MDTSPSKEEITAQITAYFTALKARVLARRAHRGSISTLAEDVQNKSMRKFDQENPFPRQPAFMSMDLRHDRFTLESYLADLELAKVVVFQEKHDNREFIVKPWDPCAFGRIAMHIIKEREDYWLWTAKDFEKELSENEAKKPPFDKLFIATLPTEGLRELAKREYDSYMHDTKEVDWYKECLPLIKRAEGGDFVAASAFVRHRSGGEYEKYKVLVPEVL